MTDVQTDAQAETERLAIQRRTFLQLGAAGAAAVAVGAVGGILAYRKAQETLEILGPSAKEAPARGDTSLVAGEVDEVLAILFKLSQSGITIIMIEHIMQAVMKFSQRVVCLDAGKIICEGTPENIVKNPEVQRAYLGD